MKHLLRKIFFWDAPAQGVLFGGTLLLFLAWGGFTMVCAGLAIHSRLFMFGVPHYLFLLTLLLLYLYSLFLVGRGVVYTARRTHTPWWLWTLAILFVPCFLYAFIKLYSDSRVLIAGTNWPEKAALWGGLFLWLAFVAWCRRKVVNPVKLLAAVLSWGSGGVVFWTLCVFCTPFEDRGPFHWCNNSLPYVLYRKLGLNGASCFWFTLAGFVLVATGYILLWSILAQHSGCSMRQLCSRGIRILWGVMAGIYPVALLLALWNTVQYRNAIRDLEAHFGHPLTAAGLENVFYDGRTPAPDYWKKVNASLKAFEEEYEKAKAENEWEFVNHPDAVLPKELYEKRRAVFLNGMDAARLDELFVSPMPPEKRKYIEGRLWSMERPELSKCEGLAGIEHRRCRYAVDAGDFETAAKSLAHMDILCDYLSKDCSTISWIVWQRIEQQRNEMLSWLLGAGLPPDTWLEEQMARLQKQEERFDKSQKGVLYLEAVMGFDLMHFLVNTGGLYAVLPKEGYYELNYHSIRFFFPQGWWLAAKWAKEYARAMKATSFDQMPLQATGSGFVDFLVHGIFGILAKEQREYFASSRVLRGLIAAELHKRRTRNYPDTMEGLPIDPFSGQPLNYRKGPCQIIRHTCKWVPGEESTDGASDGEEVTLTPQGRWIIEPTEENIEAVQVWSIGPDGRDDGGLFRKGDYNTGKRLKDDIRYIIPMR